MLGKHNGLKIYMRQAGISAWDVFRRWEMLVVSPMGVSMLIIRMYYRRRIPQKGEGLLGFPLQLPLRILFRIMK